MHERLLFFLASGASISFIHHGYFIRLYLHSQSISLTLLICRWTVWEKFKRCDDWRLIQTLFSLRKFFLTSLQVALQWSSNSWMQICTTLSKVRKLHPFLSVVAAQCLVIHRSSPFSTSFRPKSWTQWKPCSKYYISDTLFFSTHA